MLMRKIALIFIGERKLGDGAQVTCVCVETMTVSLQPARQ